MTVHREYFIRGQICAGDQIRIQVPGTPQDGPTAEYGLLEARSYAHSDAEGPELTDEAVHGRRVVLLLSVPALAALEAQARECRQLIQNKGVRRPLDPEPRRSRDG